MKQASICFRNQACEYTPVGIVVRYPLFQKQKLLQLNFPGLPKLFDIFPAFGTADRRK